MIILEDTRQQAKKHEAKHKYFESVGVQVERTKLYVGDYTLPTNQTVCIDSKKDIQELIGDICGKQHERFRNELIRAQESGIRLVILTEDNGSWCSRKKNIYNKPVRSIDDLFRWKNPRAFIWRGGKQLYPNCTKGKTIASALLTISKKYGAKFEFCGKEESGRRILELLGVVKMSEKMICGNCKHHVCMDSDSDDWICENDESDCFGCVTDYGDGCLDFEER